MPLEGAVDRAREGEGREGVGDVSEGGGQGGAEAVAAFEGEGVGDVK